MISEAYEKKTNLQGDVRKYRVWLDPNQYRMDMESRAEKGTEVGVYEHLTLSSTFAQYLLIYFVTKAEGHTEQRRFRIFKDWKLSVRPWTTKVFQRHFLTHIFLMISKFQDVYYTFNVVIRRDPKTNNFKAVLETIRQLLNTECVVPDWLTDVVLGYGEPDSAHYSK